MTTTSAPTPRRRLKPEERRAEILDAAGAVLLESGIEAMTMEAIAAKAKANKALPYYYFKTRDGILVALADREFERMAAAVVAAADAGQTYRDKLRNVIEVWINYADAQAQLTVLEVVQTRSGELEAARARHMLDAAQFFAALMREHYDVDSSEALILTGAFQPLI